jgi:hypothetical protein
VKSSHGYKKKADVLFSQLVRSVGHCLRCGTTQNLQCAHVISRRYSATRCDLRNAYCLCAKDHLYYTAWPREFSKFITEHTGSEVYDELKLKAETVTKVSWEEEYARLQQIRQERSSSGWLSI